MRSSKPGMTGVALLEVLLDQPANKLTAYKALVAFSGQ